MGRNLLRLTAANTARDFLTSNRPIKSERFSGDGDQVDFEATMNRFDLVTSQAGVTDLQRFMEIRYYFTGSAATVCALYERNRNPVEGLSLTRKALRKNYGRRNYSAQRMLDDVLNGKQISADDYKGMQKFILTLELIYKRAKETNREATFDSQDTINSILRKRMKFAVRRWSMLRARLRENWGSDDEEESEPKFEEFLRYLKRQHMVTDEEACILGTSTSAARSDKADKNKKGDGKKPAVSVQAVDAKRGAKKKTASSKRGGTTNPTPASAEEKASFGRNAGVPSRGGRGGNKSGRGRGGYNNVGSRQPPQENGVSFGPYPGKSRGRGQGRGQGRGNSNSSFGQNQVRSSAWSCPGCNGNTWHGLELCGVFKRMDPEEKFETLKLAGICLLCMGGGHIAGKCTSSNRCDKCCGRHHTLMCRGDRSTHPRGAGTDQS